MEQKVFNHNRIELLAPAGGMEQLAAAVENGADAVYLGGKAHNARAKAGNFDLDEIKRASEYCHIRGVRVYVTLNTLICDGEDMQKVVNYALKLVDSGADALIIQDIGLLNEIRRADSGIELHLSTQATVYNRSGARFAERIGCSRVVLARECSLENIRDIGKEPVELEVFVHGALCFCCSGQCQLSRYIGGRSGNRGTCAQPCRLSYSLDGKTGYHLSPKDICTVEMLPEIIEAGVSSLKIEGRLKSAEYVAAVVGIYRKYIDMYYESGKSFSVEKEDISALLQIFNRGGFTGGYFKGNPEKKLMTEDVPKHRGIRIGKVAGYDKKQIVTVEMNEKENIRRGDGIEIHLRNGGLCGNVVTFCERVKPRGKKETVRIGDIRGRDGKILRISPGDSVYRIVSADLSERLRETYREGGPDGNKHRASVPVSFSFNASERKSPSLYAEIPGGEKTAVSSGYVCARAEKKGTSEEMIRKQLSKLGGTPFVPEKIEINTDESLLIPLSVINSMRREALERLEVERSRAGKSRRSGIGVTSYTFRENRRSAIYFHTWKSFLEGKDLISDICGRDELLIFVPVYDWFEKYDGDADIPSECRVIPYLQNMTLGREDEFLKNSFTAVTEKTLRECGGIMVNNPGWMKELMDAGLEIFAGPGFNVCNGYSAGYLTEQGVSGILSSYEMTGRENGEILLMVTEHEIGGDVLTDRKGVSYSVIDHRIGGKHAKSLIISPDRRTAIPERKAVWEIPCLYRK